MKRIFEERGTYTEADGISTEIVSCGGGKWYGDAPDTLEQLYEMLEKHPLARRCEWADCPPIHGFISHPCYFVGQSFHTAQGYLYPASETQPDPDIVNFHGSFFGYSYIFQIYTNDPAVIKKLSALIRANIKRPDYLSQDKPTHNLGPYILQFRDKSRLWFRGGKYYKHPKRSKKNGK